jgi:hypothetical protein
MHREAMANPGVMAAVVGMEIEKVGPRLHPEIRKCFFVSDEDMARSVSLLREQQGNEIDNE